MNIVKCDLQATCYSGKYGKGKVLLVNDNIGENVIGKCNKRSTYKEYF